MWDRNRDGILKLQELPPFAQKNFQRVDQNRDGSISLTEHLRFLSKQKNESNQKDFRVLSNLPYADTQNPRQTLDLILPAQTSTNKKLPLIVWIHGGGWKNGDKRSGLNPHRLPALVQNGKYIGASIGYRLSGEAIWPAQIHDCKGAIRWLRAHAEKYGIDPDKIIAWGSSAGGHLVSMLGSPTESKNWRERLANIPISQAGCTR